MFFFSPLLKTCIYILHNIHWSHFFCAFGDNRSRKQAFFFFFLEREGKRSLWNSSCKCLCTLAPWSCRAEPNFGRRVFFFFYDATRWAVNKAGTSGKCPLSHLEGAVRSCTHCALTTPCQFFLPVQCERADPVSTLRKPKVLHSVQLSRVVVAVEEDVVEEGAENQQGHWQKHVLAVLPSQRLQLLIWRKRGDQKDRRRI